MNQVDIDSYAPVICGGKTGWAHHPCIVNGLSMMLAVSWAPTRHPWPGHCLSAGSAVAHRSCRGWWHQEQHHTPQTVVAALQLLLLLLLQAVLGPAPVNPLVDTLQQAGAAGQTGAIAEHCLASGVLGPLWEEVREAHGMDSIQAACAHSRSMCTFLSST
jgi:hypothetical protein